MTRDDVRTNLASWEADSADYQRRNAPQLNRWDVLGWGIWDVPEDDVHALGELVGLETLELGCGACQFGIKVAMRGARVIGIDFSEQQLRQGRANVAERGVRFPLVRGNAEELPFADGSFDLVVCDHGALSFTDPSIVVPEVARVLRSGGRLVFNMVSPFAWVCWGNDDEPAGRTLRRPYFGLGRSEYEDPSGSIVEWHLPNGEWVRIFREAAFEIEDLIELRPEPDATTTYDDFAPLDWARDYPGEQIWKVRKA